MSTQKQKIAFSDSKLKRFENALNEQSKERKAELRRSIEIKVDSQIEKKFNSFLKELKIDKILKKHAQAEKEFNDFERSYEVKRRKLKEDVESKNLGSYNTSRALWDIGYEMKIGDVVIAKKGIKEFIGYGIIESDYIYEKKD